jgi:tripartite-type tricarboxylate transporter receptor subunit TctC
MTSRRAAISLIAIGLSGVGLSVLASIGRASALDYPTRPVRFVVGFPPGGATDILEKGGGIRRPEGGMNRHITLVP